MKYVFLFASSPEEMAAFDSFSSERMSSLYERIGAWSKKYEPYLGVGEQIERPSTATTVRFPSLLQGGGTPVVTDGPFIEGKEIIGGFWIVDVPSRDVAVQMATEWPASSIVEIRPVVARQG